ncbi:MAG: ATP-binding protein [Spirochaetales bacterium]|nr:ATP-binding protein [Spirochaetales bacterium]
MFNRKLEDLIISLSHTEKNLFITGPRQAGKTTLLKELLPQKLKKEFYYLNFDDPEIRVELRKSTVAKLKELPGEGIIFDEVQKFPFIFDAIKVLIDTQKEKSFYLTGSSQIFMLKNIQESLAGRVGRWTLFPLSFSELCGETSGLFIDRIINDPTILREYPGKSIDIITQRKALLSRHKRWGGFPAFQQYKKEEERYRWLENYRKTYIEKDIRDLSPGADLEHITLFMNIIAQRTGNILSLTEMSKACGISITAVRNYLKLLELSYSVALLRPYSKNTSKRLIKSPKAYLTDTGLAGIITKEFRSQNPSGAMYETWVFCELLKWQSAKIIPPNLWFYRTSAGMEIDFIVEYDGKRLLPIEVKNRDIVDKGDGSALKRFLEEFRDIAETGIIIYTGNEIREIREGIFAVPDWVMFGGSE